MVNSIAFWGTLAQEAARVIRIRFAPSKRQRLRLGASFASDDARPTDYFAHETPNPPDVHITQLAANAYGPRHDTSAALRTPSTGEKPTMADPFPDSPHRSILIPPPLEPGDLLGLVAASGPAEPEMLDEGIRVLQAAGFRVRTGCHLYECTGYLAGTDEQRCQDLNDMLGDAEIRGVFFARGGYGIMRLLDSVDHGAIQRDPKLLVGMSDVSALSLSLYAHCGLVTYAGPMVAGQVGSGLDELSAKWFVRALTEPLNGRNLLPDATPVRVVRPGRARGPLIGGCLSLVTALMGTNHAPDFRGAILFLEDVNEPAYRIDRMLTHLKLASVLDRVAGIVLGHFSRKGLPDLTHEAADILSGLIADRQIPLLAGFPHGHVLPNLTIPHGALVEMATDPPALAVVQHSDLDR